jgi:hypothetical protein
MLAAEELRKPQPGDFAGTERPQEQRRTSGVEGDDDERAAAGVGADMVMPELEKFVGTGLRRCWPAPARANRTRLRLCRRKYQAAQFDRQMPAKSGYRG